MQQWCCCCWWWYSDDEDYGNNDDNNDGNVWVKVIAMMKITVDDSADVDDSEKYDFENNDHGNVPVIRMTIMIINVTVMIIVRIKRTL